MRKERRGRIEEVLVVEREIKIINLDPLSKIQGLPLS